MEIKRIHLVLDRNTTNTPSINMKIEAGTTARENTVNSEESTGLEEKNNKIIMYDM